MPNEKDFYLGVYNGNTIICDYGLPFEFYSNEISEIEKRLIDYFPDSTIIAITLMSTVTHYGFALIENGVKKRVKVGQEEMPVAFEMGEVTKEEIVFQKENSKVNEEGIRLFKIQDGEYVFSEEFIGEEYVFEISKRIFGFKLNGVESDELHSKTKIEKYKKCT